MSIYHVVEVDISKKQEYIFKSNKLKQIIGGSYIIKYVTEYLGNLVLRDMGLLNDKRESIYFSDDVDSNILFDKGGSSTFIFKGKEESIIFKKKFSSTVLVLFPGVDLNLVSVEFDIEKDLFTDILIEIQEKLYIEKNKFHKLHIDSFGINKKCKYSGEAASYKDGGAYLSADSYVKHVFKKSINCLSTAGKDSSNKSIFLNEYWDFQYKESRSPNLIKRALIEVDMSRFAISINDSDKYSEDDFDDEKGNKDIDNFMQDESSKMFALVTADGNGMGRVFDDVFMQLDFNMKINKSDSLSSDCNFEKYNMKLISTKKLLSEKIESNYKESFRVAKDSLHRTVMKDEKTNKSNTDTKAIIPFRRLINAGDDITFIIGADYLIDFTDIFSKELYSKTLFAEGSLSFSKLIAENYEYLYTNKEKTQSLINCEYEVFKEKVNQIKNYGFMQDNMTLSIGATIINSKYPLYRVIKKSTNLEDKCKKYLSAFKGSNNSKYNNYKSSLMCFEVVRGEISDTNMNHDSSRIYSIVSSISESYADQRTSSLDDIKIPYQIEALKEYLKSFNSDDIKGKSSIKEYARAMAKSSLDGEQYFKTHRLDKIKNYSISNQEEILSDAIMIMDTYKSMEEN